MALQSSGAISLNDIHIEAGGSSGTQCTINDADIRGLISKGSGSQMSFSEWYGASGITTEGPMYDATWQTGYYYYQYDFWMPDGSNYSGESIYWGGHIASRSPNQWTNPNVNWYYTIPPNWQTSYWAYGRSGSVVGGWYYFVKNPPNQQIMDSSGDDFGGWGKWKIWRSTSPTYPF